MEDKKTVIKCLEQCVDKGHFGRGNPDCICDYSGSVTICYEDLVYDALKLLRDQEPAIKSSVKQDDIAKVMNAINGALLDNGLHYVATGYDNTGPWLSVMIEKE